MTKDEDFKLLKIQTYSLRVNIHCQGCNQKVKKLLQRTEGVYYVKIEAELQKVTVSGTVNSDILINKLVKAGKHAELWSPNQPKTNDVIKNIQKGQKQSGLEAFKPKNNPKGAAFIMEEEKDGGEGEGEDQAPKQVRQQQQIGGGGPTNNGVNASKKVNQNMAAMRIKNAGKTNSGAVSNEIGALMDLAGFNGSTNAVKSPNGIQQLQSPPQNNTNGATNHNINGPGVGGMMMMNMNGYNNHHPMNMHMMYQRPAFITPSSNGYYYNYTPNPYSYYPYYPYSTSEHQHQQISQSAATNMTSVEDTSSNISCRIM